MGVVLVSRVIGSALRGGKYYFYSSLTARISSVNKMLTRKAASLMICLIMVTD